MTFPFDPLQGLIIGSGELEGSLGTVLVQLVLDTGATETLLNTKPLIAAGYQPIQGTPQHTMATAGGILQVQYLRVNRLQALGQDRFYLPVLAHDLPASIQADGVLGLDFLRTLNGLTLNFQTGEIIVP
jgi:predicted aspartyl protease